MTVVTSLIRSSATMLLSDPNKWLLGAHEDEQVALAFKGGDLALGDFANYRGVNETPYSTWNSLDSGAECGGEKGTISTSNSKGKIPLVAEGEKAKFSFDEENEEENDPGLQGLCIIN